MKIFPATTEVEHPDPHRERVATMIDEALRHYAQSQNWAREAEGAQF